MITARALLPRLPQAYPFQPATGVWRSVEVATSINHGIPLGRGLDVGCGDGLLTGIIDEQLKGRHTWLDIDQGSAEIALAEGTCLYEECFVAGGGSLPLESASFDFALSNSVLAMPGTRLLSGKLDQRVGPPHACLLVAAEKN